MAKHTYTRRHVSVVVSLGLFVLTGVEILKSKHTSCFVMVGAERTSQMNRRVLSAFLGMEALSDRTSAVGASAPPNLSDNKNCRDTQPNINIIYFNCHFTNCSCKAFVPQDFSRWGKLFEDNHCPLQHFTTLSGVRTPTEIKNMWRPAVKTL